MGTDIEQPEQPTTADMMRDLIQYLPSYLQTLGTESPKLDQALTTARASLAPQNAAIDLGLLQDYGVPYTEAGNAMQRSAALGTAATEKEVLEGTGGDLVNSAKALERSYSPEYYDTMGKITSSMSDIASSPWDKLSGSELEETSRGLARTGAARGLNVPSANSTLNNALTFGNLLNTRKTQQANNLSSMASTLPGLKSSVDPFQVATGRPSYGQNQGSNALNTNWTQSNSGLSLGQNLLNQINQNNQNNYSSGMSAYGKQDTTSDMITKYLGLIL